MDPDGARSCYVGWGSVVDRVMDLRLENGYQLGVTGAAWGWERGRQAIR